MTRLISAIAALSLLLAGQPARGDDTPRLPVLVPLTGVLALEGTSQRNGALLALEMVGDRLPIAQDVEDTGTSPEVAVNALE